jgi:DNA-binding transcriptional LysR family regulator
MDFEQIKTFLRVVEIGSFIAAGGKLGVTQSTISARMKEL